jgi:hypothetical protein
VFPHYSCVNGWDGPIQQFSACGPMIMNAWRKQGMHPSRWLNQDCSTTADMV